jgi:hypothetical protein
MHASPMLHLPKLLRMTAPFSEPLTLYMHMHVLGRRRILMYALTRRQNSMRLPNDCGNSFRGPAHLSL